MIGDFTVVKRNGSKEKFDIKKVDRVLKWAVKGLEGVDFEEVRENFVCLYSTNGIETKSIHQSLIDCALSLITEDSPNYQFVAGRLLNYWLRKEVWGGKNPPRLVDLIENNSERGFYDKAIFEKFSQKEINKIGEFIDHERDLNFTHSGLNQLIKKYLVQDRKTKQVFETPQFAYILAAMTLFADEKKNRLKWIKKAYDKYSLFKWNLSTPVMAGARTPLRSYASCALFEVGDSLDSIGTIDYLLKKASASRYGLGLNISRIRPVNAKIRNGDVLHTGLIPYLKNFESGIRSCHQNGLRGASLTVFINWWHYQIEDVVVLKDNALPDEKAVRFVDYAVCLSNLFIERFEKNENITLFNPDEVKDLIEKFGTPEWDELYLKYESDPSIEMKKVIPARELIRILAKQRLQTNRIYIFHIENANDFGTFKEPVRQSNLCLEIIQPVVAPEKWNDPNAFTGVCILGAINPYNIESDQDLEETCEVGVRMLDNLIDQQAYFDSSAENFAKKYRSLGIGMLNFAAWMAREKTPYDSTNAPNKAASIAEKLSFYLTKASINLAKERGKFEFYEKTKWSDGLIPIDLYKKSIDEFVTEPLSCDWESLREDLKEHGIRNSTLTSFMPVESSSLISGSTSGLEPIRDYIVSKESRAGNEIFVAPGLDKHKEYYTKVFDLTSNEPLLKVYAAINKFTDMAISANTYINVNHFENKEPKLSVVVGDILKAINYGLKTLYYNNTEDGSNSTEQEDDGCSSGACKL